MSVHDINRCLSQLISCGAIPPLSRGVSALLLVTSLSSHQKLFRLRGSCTAAASGLLVVQPTDERTGLHGQQQCAVVQEVKAPG